MHSSKVKSFSHSPKSSHSSSRRFLTLAMLVATAGSVLAQAQHANVANWKLANRFTPEYLRSYIYSSSITPGWINNTDQFWYSWRTSDGVKFYRVDPRARSKKLLFDHVKMAALLSEATKKPYDQTNLPITTLNFNKDATAFSFTVDGERYEYTLATETLRDLGKATGREGTEALGAGQGGGRRGGGGGQGRFGQGGPGANRDYRNFSPDKKSYVYALDHNLYYVEVGKEKDPVQLTKDGERYYSFGSRTGAGADDGTDVQVNTQTQTPVPAENRVRPNVTWSSDSKTFFVTRSDSRKVKDLYLVDVLAEPRPKLVQYKYSMPGEEDVTQYELFTFDKDKKQLNKMKVDKWKDESISDINFQEGHSDKLRFILRDRLQRHLEVDEMDIATQAIKPLITEANEDSNLQFQGVRYVKPNGDFIWWSERTGWGQLYLYSNDGKLKNPITNGPFNAETIVAVDGDKKMLWFRGVGKEQGENPYYSHLYRVNLDGTALTLLDPGDASHTSTPSPTKHYFVDNYSRVDMVPKVTVRDEDGRAVMDLEEMDLSRLKETGWKMPETFKVKSADGVTDIYGDMWKPFDFDPKKKYPIILNVYPGPQTESVSFTFSASASNQRLAQLGFIVIQIGNRGGSPQRSAAYHNYGYFNLRDYGLADKKAGVEQLAERFPWIDIDKVGIYGHSGGGFMTAAAMMLPPYNDFFKVGVSSSGNHDNNIYNQNWSEQNHGLKEVKVPIKDAKGGFVQYDTKFEIKVPTTVELAPNLKGNLLLVTGDMDNNVHPGNTIRLVNALIKANKRFDFMIMPGQPHGYGPLTNYFNQLSMEYFAKHLLGDTYDGAELNDKK